MPRDEPEPVNKLLPKEKGTDFSKCCWNGSTQQEQAVRRQPREGVMNTDIAEHVGLMGCRSHSLTLPPHLPGAAGTVSVLGTIFVI